MADLSLFQQLAASCATMLPLLGKEEQEEARKMVTRMLIKEDKIHFHHEDLKVEQSKVNDKEKSNMMLEGEEEDDHPKKMEVEVNKVETGVKVGNREKPSFWPNEWDFSQFTLTDEQVAINKNDLKVELITPSFPESESKSVKSESREEASAADNPTEETSSEDAKLVKEEINGVKKRKGIDGERCVQEIESVKKMIKTEKSPRNEKKRQANKCGNCKGCNKNTKDCNTCRFCLDKPRLGGANTIRQKCLAKRCEEFKSGKKVKEERWRAG